MSTIRKHTQNIILDISSFVCMTMLLVTGIVIHFILPAGSKGNTFWSFTRHEWGELHFWIAIVFTTLILVHLYLHWPWIKASLSRFGNKES